MMIWMLTWVSLVFPGYLEEGTELKGGLVLLLGFFEEGFESAVVERLASLK
jgi:hypothetical protein